MRNIRIGLRGLFFALSLLLFSSGDSRVLGLLGSWANGWIVFS